MIVYDEPDITSVLRRGREQYGFVVDTFNDPVEALSDFKVGYYDLLLLDISMPKMNGFELYKEMVKIEIMLYNLSNVVINSPHFSSEPLLADVRTLQSFHRYCYSEEFEIGLINDSIYRSFSET